MYFEEIYNDNPKSISIVGYEYIFLLKYLFITWIIFLCLSTTYMWRSNWNNPIEFKHNLEYIKWHRFVMKLLH